jgi:hypothetical protein
MSVVSYAEWLRHQGQRVFQTVSSYWVEAGPRIYQAFPYHWVISPPEDELRGFLVEHRAIGLRYSAPLETPQGAASYHAVLGIKDYNLDVLGKWARKNVRRGLANCQVEPISFERLAEEGWSLQLDTLDRQGRRLHLEQEAWRTRCLAAGNLPGFEAWGALVAGKLAASVITFRMDDCYYMLYQQCLRHYLPEHVNNALCFVVTQNIIRRPETKSILYGLHSLDASPSVDEFKFRMGYSARPVRQRVVFHPALRPLFNPASHALLAWILHLKPGNPSIAKAEGMLRFYLIGKRPLEQQDWPEVLRQKRPMPAVSAEASNPIVTSEGSPPPDNTV